MPQTKSAKKALRQNLKRRDRNRSVRSSTRTQIKRFKEALAAGDADLARQQYQRTVKKLDQTAAKGVIHKRTASRTKSRLAKQLNALLAHPPEPSEG